VILSDRSIREAMDAGRIVVEPLGENAVQPSSVDVRVGNSFRVFANHRHPYIDVRNDQELTDLVEVTDDEPFILHPGEFVLGTTFEKVTIPDDLVARLEGKSSLARLGLLIHSSLPGDETVLFCHEGELRQRRIGDIVTKKLQGSVVSFDPETFEAIHAQVTGWYEGPPDRIYEVVLASGRSVRVTAGHNLFTLDRDGHLAKVRTGQLQPGVHVAIPRSIPQLAQPSERLELLKLADESSLKEMWCAGPTVERLLRDYPRDVAAALRDAGYTTGWYHAQRGQLPVSVAAQVPGLLHRLGAADRLRIKGSRHALPPVIEIDAPLAWLLGLYTAEGYRRRTQVVVSNTDQAILDRVEAVFHDLGLPTYRSAGAVTCCSTLFSALIDWLGMGGKARAKRVPHVALGWPQHLIAAFYEGFVDGDGSREQTRDSLWTSSEQLVHDLLLIAARLGRRAAVTSRVRETGPLHQVYLPHTEHKLLTSVPLPDRMLTALREGSGLSQTEASRAAGYAVSTSLCNIENRSARDSVRLETLRRLHAVYAATGDGSGELHHLERLVGGDLAWDRVVEVRDTGRVETIYDLEVRPDGRKIENFLAGNGGVFVSNTAGFVDAGWSGHLTLELSNVANLPITLYPGMKIGQLAFFQLDQPAEVPYGSPELGSKYQGQEGPTASRYFENFDNS
jgi:deoxycytidine triphosphate deaminase/intein/homing endonuclease